MSKIKKDTLYTFARRLLQEVNISDELIENDLENLVYESGEKQWEESDDGESFLIDDYEN